QGAVEPQAVAPWLAALGLATDEDGVQETLLAAILDLTAMTRGYLLGYDGGRLARIATRRLDFATELAEGFSTTIADEALITGEPVYVIDAAGAERFRAAASVVALGLRSVVALPVATATTILGVAYADRTAIDPLLGPADLAQLQMLATYAAERTLGLRAAAEAQEARRWALGVASAAGELAATPPAERPAKLAAALARLAGADAAAWYAGETVVACFNRAPALPDGLTERATPAGVYGSLADDAGTPRWLACLAVPGRPEVFGLGGPGADAGASERHLPAALGALAPWLQNFAAGGY
ncbi:MAG: hypothetical protein JWM80_1355, partial [Cyanobacteria bacterium RYN_339]|nr:hypothetical protein [Cyanobacteria bacterium RYN_339]